MLSKLQKIINMGEENIYNIGYIEYYIQCNKSVHKVYYIFINNFNYIFVNLNN